MVNLPLKRTLPWLLWVPALLSASNATPPQPSEEKPGFFLTTKGSTVAQILRDAGANEGLSVQVSPEVQDIFMGQLKGEQCLDVLKRFAKLYHLIWCQEGSAVYVYKTSEVKREILNLRYTSFEAFENHLKMLKLLPQPHAQIQALDAQGLFELSGPPYWVSKVQTMAHSWEESNRLSQNKQENFYFFRLNHAQAEDSEIQYSDHSVTLPGVASLLRATLQAQGFEDEEGQGIPLIQADPRTNTLIIREKGQRFERYKQLIDSLDQLPQQIEISVSIIDLDARYGQELGSELSVSFYDENFHSGDVNVNGKGSLNLSVKVNDTSYFELKLDMLQEEAAAKVCAQPSILTLDNCKAVMDKSTTLYTKLVSGETAKLEAITTGTLLEVTPRILALKPPEAEEELAIALLIHLRDGKMDLGHASAGSESALPETQNSEIFTQAILKPGEGLLLGGFIREETSESSSGLPWLTNLPVLKQIFGRSKAQSNKVIRLFYLKATPLELTSSLEANEASCCEEQECCEPLSGEA